MDTSDNYLVDWISRDAMKRVVRSKSVVFEVVVRGPTPVRGAQITGPRNNSWKEDQLIKNNEKKNYIKFMKDMQLKFYLYLFATFATIFQQKG